MSGIARILADELRELTDWQKPIYVKVGATRTYYDVALAVKAGMEPAVAADPARGVVLADLGYVWDPLWARAIRARPGTALVKDGHAVLVHVPAGMAVGPVVAAMEAGRAVEPDGLELLDADRAELSNHELRKRERPFVLPLVAGQEDAVERALACG